MPTYYTHNNGGRPYKIVQSDKKIEIYGVIIDENRKEKYDNLILTVKNYKNLFTGKNGKKGNSVLIHVLDKYIYIGGYIGEFKTNEKIIEYYSPIGNNDVPYPYAVGEKHTYLMLESKKIANKNLVVEPYEQFYNEKKAFVSSLFKKFNMNIKDNYKL